MFEYCEEGIHTEMGNDNREFISAKAGRESKYKTNEANGAQKMAPKENH